MSKSCNHCGQPLPPGGRSDKRHCTDLCARAAQAKRRRERGGAAFRKKEQAQRSSKVKQMANDVLSIAGQLSEEDKHHYADWLLLLSLESSNMRKVAKEIPVDAFLADYGSEESFV